MGAVKNITAKTLKYIFLVLMVLASIFPIYWTLVNSFRSNTQIMSEFRIFPEQMDFVNFTKIFRVSSLPQSFLNSVLVTGGTMLVVALITMMAAFVLSCYRFRGGKLIYSLFTVGIFIPGATTMGTIYKLLQSMQLLGTRSGIVILYSAGGISLSIFLLVNFMKSIPNEVKEAALIDGCSPWRLFSRIIVPLARNGLVIILILTFINEWNEYLWSMILLPSENLRTLTVALAFFKGEYFTDYGLLSASVIVGLFPIIIVYLLISDQIISSISAASVKG